MSEVNVPLLRKAVEWAEAEAAKPAIDREWNQTRYISMPYYAAMDALKEIKETSALDFGQRRVLARELASSCGTAYCIAGYIGQALDARYADDDWVDDVHVSRFAAEALGIDHAQAEATLFKGDNTIEDVRRIAEDLAGERL